MQRKGGVSTPGSFPFFYPRPDLVQYGSPGTFTHAVRLGCAAGDCTLVPRGGTFTGHEVQVTLALTDSNSAAAGTQIRYCLSSSVPTHETCDVFTGTPLVLQHDTLITTRAFTPKGAALDPICRMVMNRTQQVI